MMQKYKDSLDKQVFLYYLFLKNSTSSRYIHQEYRHNREFSSITSKYMFKKYIPLLVRAGFMDPVAGGFSLVSLKKIAGKHAYKGFLSSIPSNISFHRFKLYWLSFKIEKMKEAQEYNIKAKGGIEKDLRNEAVKGDTEAMKKLLRNCELTGEQREQFLKPYHIFLSTRMIANKIGMSQKWVSNALRSMRTIGMITYTQIIKPLKDFIEDKYHYLSPEYLFNYMGRTFVHMGSQIFKIDEYFFRLV